VFRKVGIEITDAGQSPRRKNTTLKRGRKFEIKSFTFIIDNSQPKTFMQLFSTSISVYLGCYEQGKQRLNEIE
jgi:hypothetical protein